VAADLRDEPVLREGTEENLGDVEREGVVAAAAAAKDELDDVVAHVGREASHVEGLAA